MTQPAPSPRKPPSPQPESPTVIASRLGLRHGKRGKQPNMLTNAELLELAVASYWRRRAELLAKEGEAA